MRFLEVEFNDKKNLGFYKKITTNYIKLCILNIKIICTTGQEYVNRILHDNSVSAIILLIILWNVNNSTKSL